MNGGGEIDEIIVVTEEDKRKKGKKKRCYVRQNIISGYDDLSIFFRDKQGAVDGHFRSTVVQRRISSFLPRRSIITKLTVCLSKEFSLHKKYV